MLAVSSAALGATADGAAPATRRDSGGRQVLPAAAAEPSWLTPPPTYPATTAPLTLAASPVTAAVPAPADRAVLTGLTSDGIPQVALNAYRVAAARLSNADPSCGLPWYLLAGIGREESDHGRANGAVLSADGLSTPPVIGPALDGANGDRIAAPPNGLALDGDAVYAHALGPMQFIPSTWALYGADGDGDRRANVFDINDATLGAARYLCAAGGNLRGRAGQVRALLAYNHSNEYVDQVLALANAYAVHVGVSGAPVGVTQGPLAPVRRHGPLPPVNPGAPTAVSHRGGHPTRTPEPSSSATRTGASPTPTGRVGGGPVTTVAGQPSDTATTAPSSPTDSPSTTSEPTSTPATSTCVPPDCP
ncbi:lytic murein transglycosylase [uncultured Jatrophihabitans sp.]|uniref:lytic murein transglycosylase n=1 Tax=uncultured Jatrophihabitans sp. TaxID=1610747 RepID=UPI0035C9FF6D